MIEMKLVKSFRVFGCVTSILFILSQVECRNTGTSLKEELRQDDFVRFDSVPDLVKDGSSVIVRYQCSRACEVAVEVVFSTVRLTEALVFRRKWANRGKLNVPRTRLVKINFPPSLTFKRDYFLRHVEDAYDVTVRAWMDHLKRPDVESGNGTGRYQRALVRTSRLLETLPPSERPARPPPACLSWGAELVWKLAEERARACPHETEAVHLLEFPLASTGEGFGVVRRFRPFVNGELERERARAVRQPRFRLSVWIYLLNWCDSPQCAIIHHINADSKYDTPLLTLTDTGDVVFQVVLMSGEDVAFRSHTALPIHTWICLDWSVQASEVTLQVNSTANSTYKYDFKRDVHFNDTSGYFVIGGSKFMPGIHGYFGPITYHRLGTEKVLNPLTPAKTLDGLDDMHRQCKEMKEVILAFFQSLADSADAPGLSHSYYKNLRSSYEPKTSRRTWTWDMQKKHRTLFNLLQTEPRDFTSGPWNRHKARHFGRQLFEGVVRKMSAQDQRTEKPMSSLMAQLRISSCCGHHQASLLLAAIHLSGLGVSVDQQQGHVYSLIGALGDERLALMHLGYKHSQGIDGFPKDYDMAYCYYANVGRQTSIDRRKGPETMQYMTEHIHLSETEELQSQTYETGDVFQFLKLQAERGDFESQRAMGKILFWGQKGVSKDVANAAKWFYKSAMQMNDPLAMYDYSMLLLQGHGVKKNKTLGFRLLKKAAEMGSVEAINGLGWYYSTMLDDVKTAVKYFEQAAKNGSEDAIYNLGVFRLNGKHPDKPGKNESAAFQHFFKASLFGHVDGTIEVAWYLSTGHLVGVSRDPQQAVILLKQLCEKNGYLGAMLHRALQAYTQGSWHEALVRYELLAETGLGVAQSNAAHLCEELKESNGCQWRYYNYSTFNYNPHASGLLKMGDYYYGKKEEFSEMLGEAILMYARAVFEGSPQGLYNLAMLAEEGYAIPEGLLNQLGLSVPDELNETMLVEKLLQRCREFEAEEDLTPCSLALMRVLMGKAWGSFTLDPLLLPLAWATVAVLILALLITLLIMLIQSAQEFHRVDSRNTNENTRQEMTELSPANQMEVNGNRRPPGNIPRDVEIPGNPGMSQIFGLALLKIGRVLQQSADLAITVTGVCLCALCTMLLSHLL